MEDHFGRYFKSKEGRVSLRQALKNAFENIDVHHVTATVSHSTLFAAAGESDMWLRDDPALVLSVLRYIATKEFQSQHRAFSKRSLSDKEEVAVCIKDFQPDHCVHEIRYAPHIL